MSRKRAYLEFLSGVALFEELFSEPSGAQTSLFGRLPVLVGKDKFLKLKREEITINSCARGSFTSDSVCCDRYET